ncbi:methyltransferase family protein [Micromonospora pisi]|uniref:Methyltransferase family protein n=1 Tax=Micromonospora pisi TaxID=589240 RepID=A0A495JBQ5_9ACTN|nr:class I SAM-dependent methyltransferase [Micromonospora pisi]RKR86347.1 methyltransferase family protein [Micromonospora pisi]
MTVESTRAFAAWLGLREPADAAARAVELVEPIRRRLAGGRPTVVHDLGTGTGSMGRWLAPLLPGPQHWIMYDRDPELLAQARAEMPGSAADGAPVTVETRLRDITRLTAADLDGATLITASALLDMLTAEEIERIVSACAATGCPTLLTISVIGQVELTPPDPLDAQIVEAFNAHQRRTVDGQRLLGPDAVAATLDAFGRHGIDVLVRPSPWRLGPGQAELTVEWFEGWVGAAREQRPDLGAPSATYARSRLAQATSGGLGVVVWHNDLLANCE